MKDLKAYMLARIDAALAVDWRRFSEFVTTARAAVEDVAGRDSAYARRLDEKPHRYLIGSEMQDMAGHLAGILKSLRAAVDSGYLASASELIRGEVFGDYLDMAAHLVDQHYKDAAAVVGGSTLESHLRQLAKRHGIDAVQQKGNDLVPKKADTLNAELAAKGVYGKGDQKSVTSWLDLRNNAAHGHYDRYTEDMVRLFLQSIRDFISRHPA